MRTRRRGKQTDRSEEVTVVRMSSTCASGRWPAIKLPGGLGLRAVLYDTGVWPGLCRTLYGPKPYLACPKRVDPAAGSYCVILDD